MEEGRFLVFFREGASDLAQAAVALKAAGFAVSRVRGRLRTRWQRQQTFTIAFSTGKTVQDEAAMIGRGTEYEALMREYTARFEVTFKDH
jgi:hypothetical protein